MAREHVRALELAPGDRILVDDHPGVWVVQTRSGDPRFLVDVEVVHEITRDATTLHVFADQGFERML